MSEIKEHLKHCAKDSIQTTFGITIFADALAEVEKLESERDALQSELEQLKAYRAITDRVIGVIHTDLKLCVLGRIARPSVLLGELEDSIAEINKLEGISNA